MKEGDFMEADSLEIIIEMISEFIGNIIEVEE